MTSLPVIRGSRPPNFMAIHKIFPLAGGRGVLFAYAPYIYNPSRNHVPPELVAHEKVHIERQGDDPEGWWKRYLVDKAFRLEEERVAHVAEARHMLVAAGYNRAARRRVAKHVGARLAAPLYRTGISRAQGAALIREGLKECAPS